MVCRRDLTIKYALGSYRGLHQDSESMKFEWGLWIRWQNCITVNALILMAVLWSCRRVSLFLGNTH